MQVEYSKKQLLIAGAMKRVLRPFVKIMLANDLNYLFAIDLLKTMFVEVAEHDFSSNGVKQTDTRISLISGVHRKDVRRLREYLPDVHEVVPENISLGAQLIAIWNSDARYLNAEGKPKPLPRLGAGKEMESFENLVRSVSKDIHPRAVLDEWRRLGFAEVDDDNYVHLKSDAFISSEGWEEKTFFFAHNLHDHASAAVSNMLESSPSFLERCVYYEELSMQQAQHLAELAKVRSMETLNEVFKAAEAYPKMETNSADQKMRITYGVYFYQAPMTDEVNRS